MSNDSARRPVHAPRPERTLWIPRKYTRAAEARDPHPHRGEVVFHVDDLALWSQPFKDGGGAVLGEIAETKRREFEARGWQT